MTDKKVPEVFDGIRLRIYMGGAYHDEVFVVDKPNEVPPAVQEFVNAFLSRTDTVWKPNASNLRAYMIRNLAGYRIDNVKLNREEKPAAETK